MGGQRTMSLGRIAMEAKQSWNRFSDLGSRRKPERLVQGSHGHEFREHAKRREPVCLKAAETRSVESGNTNAAAAGNLFRAPEKLQLHDAGLSHN